MNAQEPDLSPQADPRTSAIRVTPVERWPWLWQSATIKQSPRMSVRIRLPGGIDLEAIHRALRSMMEDHPLLGSEYRMQGGELALVACRASHLLAIGEHPDNRTGEVIQPQEGTSTGPMFHCWLTRVEGAGPELEIAVHRLAFDRWSLCDLVNDFLSRLAETDGTVVTSLRVQPKARIRLGINEPAEQLDYWRTQLSDAPALLQIPTDHARPTTGRAYRTDRMQIKMPAQLTQAVRTFASTRGVSVFTVLLAIWATTLSRWTGQSRVVIGTRVGRRMLRPLENTLPVLVEPGEQSLNALSDQVGKALDEAHERQAVPFERIVDALNDLGSEGALLQVRMEWNEPSVSRTALPLPLAGAADGIEILDWRAGQEIALALRESSDGIGGTLLYACDLFEATTVKRLANCWQTLLENSVANPRNAVARLPMLSSTEREIVVSTFNRTDAVSSEHLIHELFEEQVRRTPEAIALKYEARTATFRELNSRANQLARHLRLRGVQPDSLVALCVHRGIDMVVGMLGILKAGGAYVPLDPAYPAERLQYMLENASPNLIVTHDDLRHLASTNASEVVALDGDWAAISSHEADDLPPPELGWSADNLAYVIYTSGSTGLPKGAMNEHRGMVNRIMAQQNVEMFQDGDICCQRTSLSFVDSVFETFGALCAGVPLVIVPGAVLADPFGLAALIKREMVTRLTTVPSFARSMLDSPRLIADLAALRSWTLSGEEVRSDLLRKLQRALPACEFIIQYGSSEVSSDAVIHKTRHVEDNRVPIGRPLQNVRIYILDPYGEPVPVGVAGEICVAGVGVGRGYANNPQLTSERFTRDPFKADPRARLYRMGDLGRWRKDGSIEHLGRKDNQVKIRGFRIELGEIESQLLRYQGVAEAVVLLRENDAGLKQLVAYITTRESPLSREDLRRHLQARLPEYMVPAAVVILDRMPLTPNGKLDRRALPAPADNAFARRPYEPPATDMERRLAALWSELLGVPRIGRHDHFFELGGHSLQIVAMIERLREVQLAAQAHHLFQSPSLAGMAGTLEQGGAQDERWLAGEIPRDCESITPAMVPLARLEAQHIEMIAGAVSGGPRNIQDVYPLTPLQEGMLFHHLLDGTAGDTYVASTILSVASQARLEALFRAFQAVVDRHDALRTSVLWEQLPHAVQVVHRQATLPITIVQAGDSTSRRTIDGWTEAASERMDLRKAPLMRVYAAPSAGTQQWLVLLQFHHMIDDDVSLKAMIGEVTTLVEHRERELLPPVAYRDHVARILGDTRRPNAERFFREKLGDVEEPTAPFGLTDVHGDGRATSEARGQLAGPLAQALRMQARDLGVSVAALFHAIWSLVVARVSGRDDVVFGTILLGRLAGLAGSQRALGMFINTLPVRLRMRDVSAKALVEHAHAELISLLPYEQSSLAVAQRCSGISGSVPLFGAVLNFRHGSLDLRAEWARIAGVEVIAVVDRTNYPMTLSVDDTGEDFLLTAQMERRIPANRIIAYTQSAAQSLLEALERAPDTPAVMIEVLPVQERARLQEFNSARLFERSDAVVSRLVEEQAHRSPDKLAVCCSDGQLTYGDLNRKADQVASVLMRLGVRPNTFVGLFVERGLDMVVGLLGILKAGGAYVPMDVSYPAERIAHMLSDSAPLAVLTQVALKDRLPMSQAAVLALDDLEQWMRVAAGDRVAAIGNEPKPTDLAYVIYTSGSTGMPKGVMVAHRGLTNLAHWAAAKFNLNSDSRASCVAAIGFDAATWEVWPILCAGGTLLVSPAETVGDVERLLDWWAKQSLDLSFLPTPIAEFAFTRGLNHPALRNLVVGGERLRTPPPWDAPALLNAYGPTEITVLTTIGRIRPADECLHIGAPIENSRVYILDKHQQRVPIGVQGEIYIGGVGVARGYLNNPGLTASSFVADPFSTEPQARMYRSGDLGVWREDGTIEYRGRGDDQVKIRGFRIELGEIEAALRRQPDVAEAIVQVHVSAHANRSLVAYVVGTATVRELRDRLSKVLPEYMIPSAFVLLERMPLTPNGKIDKRALPEPDRSGYVAEMNEPPAGEVEQVLAEIWRSLLNVPDVGREQNFFELGGHSLLATQMLVRIRSRFEVDVSMRTLFSSPTLRALASHVEQARTLMLLLNEESGMEQLVQKLASMSDADAREMMRAMEIRGAI